MKNAILYILSNLVVNNTMNSYQICLVSFMNHQSFKRSGTHNTGFIDTSLIYSRAIVLSQNSSNQYNLAMEDILSHELCSVTLPLFFFNGSMRVSKDKSKLKKRSKE